MKELFDQVSFQISKIVAKKYSTSFSLAVRMLSPKIRPAIYSIYGFVRLADEIADTFHAYDKKQLITDFEYAYDKALSSGISLNPILNAFQATVKQYNISDDMIRSFLRSMRWDLSKKVYRTKAEYEKYIYGSADVVGLMCLKVFVNGDETKYLKLKEPAMRLGSAFQKVNFLRDLKYDTESLQRSYFPNLDPQSFNEEAKAKIIEEIEADFSHAYRNGILKLPEEAKFGVYVAYVYYKSLLRKLKKTAATKITKTRVRISNPMKINLLARSYMKYKLNLI